MTKRVRSQSEIFQDVLMVILEKRNVSKTHIMQRAYLNQKSFQKYFTSLLENGYITISQQSSDKYMITAKGREILDQLRDMNRLISIKDSS